MTERCFLDMDGVLANFVEGVCRAHSRPDPYLDATNFGNFDIEIIWGMSARDFWTPCDGPTFWEDLQPMPDARNIIQAVTKKFGKDNICVLTAPSLSPYCVPGKRKWLKEWFPELKDVLFGSAKQFLAHPNSWLVDDQDNNVDSFLLAKGNGILVPRLWNREHKHADLSITRLMCKLGVA